jgi:hypothetical protein
MQNQGMEPWKAFSELIDNSFDAEAKTVQITINKSQTEITVLDDGLGVADLTTLARLGSHRPEGRSTSGRYGIGLKEAVASLGAAYKVESIRNQLKSSIYVDFNTIIESGKWTAQEDGPIPANKEKSGTTITISQLKDFFYAATVRKHLSTIFAPALKSGKKLFFYGVKVEPPLEEPLSGRIEGKGEYKGKQFQWHAGITSKNSKTQGGWTIALKHRIIKNGSLEGIPAHYIASKFYGYIELLEKKNGPKWTPTKHKDNVGELTEICKFLYPEVQHLLQKCTADSEIVVDAERTNLLNEFLNNYVPEKKKEARNKTFKKTGINEPTGTGGKRKTATKIQEGDNDILSKKKGLRFAINFDQSEKLISVTGSSEYNKVSIGMLNPFWKKKSYTQEDVFKFAAVCALTTQGITAYPDDEDQPVLFMIKKEDGSSPREKWFSALNRITTNAWGITP